MGGRLPRMAVGIALLIGSACGAAPEPQWAGDPASLVPELCGNVPKGGTDEPGPEAARLRARGLAALREGDFARARERFDEALEITPGNVALVALHAVAEDGLRVSLEEATRIFDEQRLVKLEVDGGDERRASKAAPVTLTKLGTVSVEEDADLVALGAEAVSAQLPRAFRRVYALRSAAVHRQGGVAIYARNQRHYVVQVDAAQAKERVAVADFSTFAADDASSFLVVSAAFEGPQLYTAIHLDGEPALVAHDRHGGELLWRIAGAFTDLRVVGEHLVALTASGQTAQLVVLDRSTGRRLATRALEQAGAELFELRGLLVLRHGGSALLLTMGQRSGKPPPPGISLADYLKSSERVAEERSLFMFPPEGAVPMADEHACAIDHALSELDAGSYDAAVQRLARMERAYPQNPVVVALAATSRFMHRRIDVAGEIDLGRVRPRELSRLPSAQDAERAPSRATVAPPGAALVKLGSQPSEDLERWAVRNGVARLSLRPDDLPATIPRSYGRYPLSEWLRDEGGDVLVYGRRYLMLVRDGRLEQAFDARPLLTRPDAEPAHDGVDLAMRRGDTLFVSFTDPVERIGGVAVIDLVTGRARWRSMPLPSGSPFALAGEDVVVTAGSTLHLLRVSDGSLVGQLSLEETARGLAFVRERLLVNLNTGSHEYAIRHGGG